MIRGAIIIHFLNNLFLVWNSKIFIRAAKKRIKNSQNTEGTLGKKFLLQNLPRTATIIEIGCHVGVDTAELGLMFPLGEIIAFEADPKLYLRVQQNLKVMTPNVTVVGAALDSSNGVSTFNVSSGDSDASGSLLEPSLHLARHPGVSFLPENKVVVPAITLDSYLAHKKINSKVDFIWMDVQGAELNVLRGALNALLITKFIYCEVAKTPVYTGGVPYSELVGFLNKHGFTVEKEFFPAHWDGEGNVLFMNRNIQ